MSLPLVLLLLGGLGAVIDLGLHFAQLFPRFNPPQSIIGAVTLLGGLLMVLSCAFAFNLAAFLMGLGIALMALYSLITGKEVH